MTYKYSYTPIPANLNLYSGDRIETIEDSNNNADLESDSSSSRPYEVTRFGFPAMNFQGSHGLRTDDNHSHWFSGGGFAVKIIFTPDGVTSYQTLFSEGGGFVPRFRLDIYYYNDSASMVLLDIASSAGISGLGGSADYGITVGKPSIIIVSFDIATQQMLMQINGVFVTAGEQVAAGSHTSVNNTSHDFALGMMKFSSGYNYHFIGDIFKLEVDDDPRTPAEMDAEYLIEKAAFNRPPVFNQTTPFTATWYENASNSLFYMIATDPDGDTLAYSFHSTSDTPSFVLINPNTGVVSVNSNYGDNGTYNLVFEVTDGSEAVVSVPVTLEVLYAYRAPRFITSYASLTFNEGQSANTTFIAETDNGTYTWSYSGTVLPNGVSFVGSGNTAFFVGTPSSSSSGVYNIILYVSDGTSTTLLYVTMTINNVVQRATISGTLPTSVSEGQLMDFTPTVSNPEGSNLTFQIWYSGTVPSWMSFNTSTGRWSGTPGYEDAGTFGPYWIGMDDTYGNTWYGPETLTIHNTNQRPNLSHAMPAIAYEGSLYSGSVMVSDPDGDTITVSVPDKPAWMTITRSGNTLTCTGTPGFNNAAANVFITFNYTDGEDSRTYVHNMTIFNTNQVPQIGGVPVTKILANEFYSFIPNINDLDGETLTLSIQNKPPGATFNTATGELFWQTGFYDHGIYENIIITVTDGIDSVSLPPFDLEVEYVNRIEKYVAMFVALFPFGAAWNFLLGKNFNKFIRAICEVIADWSDHTRKIQYESFPATTTSLDEWEQQRGITSDGLSDEDRRTRLASFYTSQENQSPTAIREAINALGLDVGLYENMALNYPSLWLATGAYLLVNGDIPFKKKDYVHRHGDGSQYGPSTTMGAFYGMSDVQKEYPISDDINRYRYYFTVADPVDPMTPLSLPADMKDKLDETILKNKPLHARAIMNVNYVGG